MKQTVSVLGGDPRQLCLAELFRAYEESHDPEASAAENLSISILGLVFARELAAKLGGVLRVFSTERANAVLRFELSDSCVSRSGESLLTRSTGRDFSPREPESPRRLPPPEGGTAALVQSLRRAVYA